MSFVPMNEAIPELRRKPQGGGAGHQAGGEGSGTAATGPGAQRPAARIESELCDGDSNPQAFRRWNLNPVRLPVPPPSRTKASRPSLSERRAQTLSAGQSARLRRLRLGRLGRPTRSTIERVLQADAHAPRPLHLLRFERVRQPLVPFAHSPDRSIGHSLLAGKRKRTLADGVARRNGTALSPSPARRICIVSVPYPYRVCTLSCALFRPYIDRGEKRT